MAKKRLNIKFIVILSIVLATPLGGLFLWKVVPKYFPQVGWIWRGTPQKHAEQAKALFDQGKFYEAGEKYKRAVQVRGAPTAELLTNIGDCYSHLVLTEGIKGFENLRLARLFWDQALSIDPTYIDAQRRLFDLFLESAEASRGEGAALQWQEVRELADRILKLDPSDRGAKLAMQRAVVMRWISGAEADPQRIQATIDELTVMTQATPFDPDAFWLWAQAKMYRAEERRRVNDRAGALEIAEQVKQSLLEKLERHPDNAQLHYRASTVYRLLSAIERSQDQAPKYIDEVNTELDKAARLVQRTDPTYLEIKLSNARQLEPLGRIDDAEKIYRDLLAEFPDDLRVRVFLAELLSRRGTGHEEALKLLEGYPPPDPKVYHGIKARRFKEHELVALSTAVTLKLDLLPRVVDSEQYDKMLKEIEQGYQKLLSDMSEGPTTLLIRGQIELAKGQYIQAVQTLERAAQSPMSPQLSIGEIDQYYKTLIHLARANILTQQTARAKALLTKIVADFPKSDAARIHLVQLLLREKEFDEAKPHLEALQKSMPNSSVVTRLVMFSLDPEKDKDKLAELYATLPETTPEEFREKAQLATYCGRRDEAARLLEKIRQIRPNDVDLLGSLALLYSELGDRGRAVALVNEAVAKYPDNPKVKIIQAQVEGTNVAEVTGEIIEQIADPFEKEMARFRLAIQENREQDAMEHVKKAHQIKPDDGMVLSLMFQYALATKNWDQAAGYMETLARMNQDKANGLLYRVRYALARGNVNEAADKARQLTQMMPEFAQSWVVLGQVQMAQGQTTPGKHAEAFQNFLTALTKQAQNLDAIRGAIGCSYAMGQPATAKQYIDEGRKLFPMNVSLREMEIEHELRYGDAEKAIAPRQQMLDLAIKNQSPDEARARLMLGSTYLAVARKKESADAKPFYEKARDTYKAAMEKWPDELRFVQLYATACMQLGTSADGEKAIQALIARDAWKGLPDPVIMLAQYYDRLGKSAEQEKVLRDYLAASPANALVQKELALYLSRHNKLDEALKLLEPTADDPAVRKLRIELQINGGRLDDALKEIQTVLATTPNPPAALLNRQAYVYMNSGRATEALAVLDKVLAREPSNAEALLYRSSIYVTAAKNLDAAIRDLQLVRDYMDDTDSRMLLADAFVKNGDLDQAIREMEATIQAKPEEKTPRLKLVDLYSRTTPPRWIQAERVIKESRSVAGMTNDVDFIHAEAVMWLGRKDYDKARFTIEQAIRVAPGRISLLQTYCDVLMGLKQYQPLLKITDPIIANKQTPAPWWVYQFRGRAKKALDDKQGAIEEWSAGLEAASAARSDAAAEQIINTIADEVGVKAGISRVLARAEKEPRWRLMAAYLYQKDGDLLSAIQWIEKALADEDQMPPDSQQTARRMAGTFYLALDPPDTEKAIANYRKMIERNPNDVAALNNLACTLILPNSGYTAADALPYSQKAYDTLQQAGSKNAYINDTHGYVLVLNGRVDEGIARLHEAVDSEPIPDAYYHLGEAYLAQTPPNLAAANESLHRALELIERAAAENKLLDTALKSKVEKALERCRQAGPTTTTASGT